MYIHTYIHTYIQSEEDDLMNALHDWGSDLITDKIKELKGTLNSQKCDIYMCVESRLMCMCVSFLCMYVCMYVKYVIYVRTT